jgi:hypothetical protein
VELKKENPKNPENPENPENSKNLKFDFNLNNYLTIIK